MRVFSILLLSILILACDESEEDPLAVGDGDCTSWIGAQSTSTVASGVLAEVSGMATSHRFPGIFWMHNDAGNSAALFGVDGEGQTVGSWSLLGTENRDWEDLSAGPCVSADQPCTCLYLADVGDNDVSRSSALVYRLPEPDATASSGGQVSDIEELWFVYPDGLARDAEALAVEPSTGEVIVVAKALGSDLTEVFALPDVPALAYPESAPAVLEHVADLDLISLGASDGGVTAADVSPLGRRLALRTDEDLLVLDVPDGGSLADAFTGEIHFAPAPDEDGEAVAFSVDGRALLLVGEGIQPTLWEVRCNVFQSASENATDPLVECGG